MNLFSILCTRNSTSLFKHIREINHLKSQVLVSSDFNGLEIDEAEKILSEVVAEYKKESQIIWK